MIDATELRPGNLVLRWGVPKRICGTQALNYTAVVLFWSGNIIEQVGCQEINPVPITPEILQACGFTGDDSLNDFESSDIYLEGACFKLKNAGNYNEWYVAGHDFIPQKYLHQLQNLCFAITGIELIYKPI